MQSVGTLEPGNLPDLLPTREGLLRKARERV